MCRSAPELREQEHCYKIGDFGKVCWAVVHTCSGGCICGLKLHRRRSMSTTHGPKPRPLIPTRLRSPHTLEWWPPRVGRISVVLKGKHLTVKCATSWIASIFAKKY